MPKCHVIVFPTIVATSLTLALIASNAFAAEQVRKRPVSHFDYITEAGYEKEERKANKQALDAALAISSRDSSKVAKSAEESLLGSYPGGDYELGSFQLGKVGCEAEMIHHCEAKEKRLARAIDRAVDSRMLQFVVFSGYGDQVLVRVGSLDKVLIQNPECNAALSESKHYAASLETKLEFMRACATAKRVFGQTSLKERFSFLEAIERNIVRIDADPTAFTAKTEREVLATIYTKAR